MLTYFEEVQRGNLSEGVVRDGICSSRSGEKYFQGNMFRGKCPIIYPSRIVSLHVSARLCLYVPVVCV